MFTTQCCLSHHTHSHSVLSIQSVSYNFLLGSTIPVFLGTPDEESDAEGLRPTLVVPPVLLEPEGVRVLKWKGRAQITITGKKNEETP